jgi:8-oxo-dGTP diphosphatase
MGTEPAVLEVVAAVIERDTPEGKMILIGQRLPGGRHPGKWEFPGGKVEPGEESRVALARELREELGIEARIGPEIERYDFRYGEGAPLRLIFFRVREFTGAVINLDFARIVWEKPDKLLDYDFLAGDVEFVRRLAS